MGPRLCVPADGNVVDVIVDPNEDIGRVGFAGLLADCESRPATAVESPESWAPLGVSVGAFDHGRRSAVATFCHWLADQRSDVHS